jgi:hypothetical protein
MDELKIDNKNSIELKDLESLEDKEPINNDIPNDKKISLLQYNEQNKEVKENIIIDNDKSNTLYGNNISIKKPRKIGNMWAFLYYNDNPLIVIGPDCK